MNAYLDASFLVALFTNDPHTVRAESFLSAQAPELVLSDFGALEFVSAIARRVRTAELTPAEARTAFGAFDAWAAATAQAESITPADFSFAQAMIRGLHLNLRAPDALHIALAERIGATLVTFDQRMAMNALALGASVAA